MGVCFLDMTSAARTNLFPCSRLGGIPALAKLHTRAHSLSPCCPKLVVSLTTDYKVIDYENYESLDKGEFGPQLHRKMLSQ